MSLDSQLISQFAKAMVANNSKKTETTTPTVYGKATVYNGRTYVQLDGSELLTPVESTSSVKDGDRVTVKIENHTATITGNLSDPAASSEKVTETATQISEFEIIIAHRVTAEEIQATNAYIENLKGISAKFDELSAVTAEIEELQAKMANINHLTAMDIEAINAELEHIRAEFGEFGAIDVEDLNAANAEIDNLKAYMGEFTYVSTDVLEAMKAKIKQLDVDKLNAKDAKLEYATINFANITEAAVKKIFADYGIIDELIIEEGTVVKELIGVLIKGDLIEVGTLKVDRLVVKGTDGNYYALSTDFSGIEGVEPVEEDMIHGSTIIAKSVTAEKIRVDDLVAFGATIAGFNIVKDEETGLGKLYSLTKESVDNSTPGIYMDHEGQLAVGDSNHYIKFHYDEESDTYRLEISADSVIFGGGKTVESEFSSINETLDKTTASAVQSTTKLEQLRELLSQVVTDENGQSLMIETPDSYTMTSEIIDAVDGGIVLDGVTTTTGGQVYTLNGEYYTIVDSIYYKVDYIPGTCTFNISDLEAAIEAANSGLSNLTGQLNTIDGTVVAIQKSIDELGLIGGYIYIDEEYETDDGETVPAIVLGESDSDFKVIITNKQIAFMEGSAVPAYISGQTLIAQNIEVKQQLTQGGFSWVTHDGNLGLVWTGPVTANIRYTITGGTSGNQPTNTECDGPTVTPIGESFAGDIIIRPYEDMSLGIQLQVYVGDALYSSQTHANATLSYDETLGTNVYTFNIAIPLVTADIDVKIIIA